ncbi:MAG: SDR family oxidoreductase [Chitinophagaceae bacterium]|nr:SDR family oxidoreductase [Chitinophagaceae bacterium]
MYQTPFHSKPLSSFTFLVTGGAGFIGSHLVEYLLKYGAGKVRVLDNLLTGDKDNVAIFQKHADYEFLEGDIRELKDCMQACEGIDFVLHEAALGSVQRSILDPVTTNHINAGGFLNMLWAAKEKKVKRLVYASSSSVYGDHPGLPKTEDKIGKPLSPYAVSKYSNELYAGVFSDNFEMELIGLRYFNVFGPRQNPEGPYAAVIPAFIRDIKKNKPPVINGDGSNSRDFTFIENAVQANIKALFVENSMALNEVYNVAVGEQYTVKQLFDAICKCLGRELTPQFESPRKGDIAHSLADISKAKKLLDYHPAIQLEEGLRMLLNQ